MTWATPTTDTCGLDSSVRFRRVAACGGTASMKGRGDLTNAGGPLGHGRRISFGVSLGQCNVELFMPGLRCTSSSARASCTRFSCLCRCFRRWCIFESTCLPLPLVFLPLSSCRLPSAPAILLSSKLALKSVARLCFLVDVYLSPPRRPSSLLVVVSPLLHPGCSPSSQHAKGLHWRCNWRFFQLPT